MARYIDEDKIINKLKKVMADYEAAKMYEKAFAVEYALELIKRIPATDVQEVKHAKWVSTDMYDAHHNPIFECTNCHREVADGFIKNHSYCLHCGAKMDGKDGK